MHLPTRALLTKKSNLTPQCANASMQVIPYLSSSAGCVHNGSGNRKDGKSAQGVDHRWPRLVHAFPYC